MDMFLQKYFLDEGGKPDRSKTPTPIPLPGFLQRSQMHAAAECVPGLQTHSAGQGDDRTIVVGWDRSAVWRVAGQVAEQSALKQQDVEEAEWDKLMQRHEAFVAQARSRYRADEFSIYEIGGVYVIECEEMGSYSSADSYNNDMRLKIAERNLDGWVGMFDFGVLEGIMLLDESKENLALRVESLDRKSDEYDDEDVLGGEADDGSLEDDGSEEDDGSQPDANENTSPAASQKRKASSPSLTSRPHKKQKQPQLKPNGGTVFLQWRGAETGEGVIQIDNSNEHVGQLDFCDNDGFEFEGIADFGFVGRKIRFHGYKVQSMDGPATRFWGDYSGAAYERARVGRWR